MTSAYEQGTCPQVEIRHRLRIAREHAGLDQGQLAELIGVSRNTISNAEVGAVSARKIIINAWALACGVPASWIVTGEPTGPGPGPTSGLGIISTEDQQPIQLSSVLSAVQPQCVRPKQSAA